VEWETQVAALKKRSAVVSGEQRPVLRALLEFLGLLFLVLLELPEQCLGPEPYSGHEQM